MAQSENKEGLIVTPELDSNNGRLDDAAKPQPPKQSWSIAGNPDGKNSGNSFMPLIGVYVAFMAVGTGCGWFLNNSLYGLLSNKSDILPEDMAGRFSIVNGVVGIGSSVVYFGCMSMRPDGLSKRSEEVGVVLLIMLSMAGFLMLAFFWDVFPGYPFLLVGSMLANLVGNFTYYILFPVVSTYYGGWLIAPVRAGTDLSSLVTSIIGQAQYIDGDKVKFPVWILFTTYAVIASLGLMAWIVIIKFGVGIRSADDKSSSGSEFLMANQSLQSGSFSGGSRPQGWLSGLSCPRSLVVPVMLATLTQIFQWALVTPLGEIGALMTDPVSCDGDHGSAVYRQSLTVQNIMVPVGSLMSSLIACPRSVFNILSLFQAVAAFGVCSSAFGIGRSFWITSTGGGVYVACFALVGALEGYLLTMAYRYIGDADDIAIHLRQSSSRLLSLLGVIAVNPINILLGSLMTSGFVECVPP
jgi:hypothetical protein